MAAPFETPVGTSSRSIGWEKKRSSFLLPREQFLLETDQIFVVFFIDRQHFTGLLRETGDHVGNDLYRSP